MKIIDKISHEVQRKYIELTGKDKDNIFLHYYLTNLNYQSLVQISKSCKSLNQISFPYIIPYVSNLQGGHWKIKEMLENMDKTGLFKLELNSGEIILFARWIEGAAKYREWSSVIVATTDGLSEFFKISKEVARKNAKPKKGIYTISIEQFLGLQYKKVNSLPNSPVIHPEVENILKEVDFYFDNLEIFKRFGQNGNRKIILMSEPGTGKSSLFYKISKIYKDKASIVYGMSIGPIIEHMKVCAKNKVPTIIFIEDVDSILDGNDSYVLNFLDGVLTPPNPAGTFIAMSTNFPERIEPRILQRPGRVDKIFQFGLLEKYYAVECAKLYFENYVDKISNEELEKIVTKMTGAQIKELSQSCFSFAASSNRDIDVKLIEEVKSKLTRSLQEAYRYAEKNSLRKGKGKIGFVSFYNKETENGI